MHVLLSVVGLGCRTSPFTLSRILALSQSANRNKIGLLGPYSFGNLGNAALQKALVQQIDKYLPDSEIYGCYIDPQRGPGAHRVLTFPLNRDVPWDECLVKSFSRATSTLRKGRTNWAKRIPLVVTIYPGARDFWRKCKDVKEELAFLLRCRRFLKDFRMLIVGLGGVIDDTWNGPWGDPFSLFKWAVLAKITGTPILFLSVGAEKIETTLGKFFLKKALALARFRSYRDCESKQKAEEMGVAGLNYVFPDLAFSLEIQDPPRPTAYRTADRLVGVSPMAYCDPRVWPVKDIAAYRNYLETLSALVLWLVQRRYKVVLFATQIRMDQASVAELKEMVLGHASSGVGDWLSEANVQTVDEFLSFASRLELVVSSRLHGVILPFLARTPALAISHASKIDSLMADMGLSEYCVGIRSTNLESLSRRILAIEANQEILRDHIGRRVDERRAALKKQFDFVFRS